MNETRSSAPRAMSADCSRSSPASSYVTRSCRCKHSGDAYLDVSHVEIEPAAVQEKSAVARRFLVIAVMKIDRAGVGFAEQIIFDLRRPKLGIHVRLVFAEKTTVLGFDSNDSIHSNQITNRMATWLSQKECPLTFILSPKWGEANRMTQQARPNNSPIKSHE